MDRAKEFPGGSAKVGFVLELILAARGGSPGEGDLRERGLVNGDECRRGRRRNLIRSARGRRGHEVKVRRTVRVAAAAQVDDLVGEHDRVDKRTVRGK